MNEKAEESPKAWPLFLGPVLLALIAGGKAPWWWKAAQDKTSNEWPDYRGCQTQSPYGDPPLLVKFADGKEAYVNFRTIIKLNQEKVDAAAQFYYSPDDAYIALLESTKGAVYAELEKHTEAVARKSRSELAVKIINATRGIQEKTAFTVHEFDFLEFCTPQPTHSQDPQK